MIDADRFGGAPAIWCPLPQLDELGLRVSCAIRLNEPVAAKLYRPVSRNSEDSYRPRNDGAPHSPVARTVIPERVECGRPDLESVPIMIKFCIRSVHRDRRSGVAAHEVRVKEQAISH